MTELPQNEAHLWYVLTDAPDLQAHESWYLSLCTPAEKEQHSRYHFAKDKWLYLITRALVRTTLSHYLEPGPDEWTFDANHYGKPFVNQPAEFQNRLSFNLTNTRGLVAMLVAQSAAVGIDAEYTSRKVDALSLAPRFFSQSEQDELRRHPPHQRQRRFLEYWTLKESFIKAKGMGLSIPLDKFSMRLADPSIGIKFHGLTDDPTHWQFTQFELASGHLLATAINAPTHSPFKITPREVAPKPTQDP